MAYPNSPPDQAQRNKFSAARFKAIFIKQRKTGGDPIDYGMNPLVVPLTIELAPTQTADAFQITDGTAAHNILFNITATGQGVARRAYAQYNFAVDGGAIGLITPAVNQLIPANAIITGVLINPTTALVGAGATVAIGTSAGSSAASIKAATGVATYSVDAMLAGIPVWTAGSAFKMSAAGLITLTVAGAPLTAGLMEIWIEYLQSASA